MVLLSACVSRDVRVARRAMARGDFDSATEGYRRAAEAEPDEPSRWLDLARAELMADRPAEARSAFARLASLRPLDPHPIVEMGFTHELERNYERALESYMRAVEIAPTSAYPHRVLGTRLLRWGQHAEALEPLGEAFAREPSHAETAKALALAHHAAGDSDAAVRTYRAGLAASPGDLGLRLGLAAMLINVGAFVEALEVYEDLCGDIPGFAAAHAGRGILLHELGRMEEAEAAFLRAAEVAPQPEEYEARLHAYRQLRAEAERESAASR
ncbi:MAG: tetratricopeptide repeat protein [Polyangiales bacterium]